MAETPPASEAWRDPQARGQAWRVLAPALVFLAHFGAVYGWAGLACAFGWGTQRWGPLGMVPAGILLLTIGALAALWFARAGAVPAAPEQRLEAYDPQERAHFLVTVARMVGWLSAVGILAVAAMGLIARTCGIAP